MHYFCALGRSFYRSRNWEESPDKIGQCTVESTDGRKFVQGVTENNRLRPVPNHSQVRVKM